MEVDPHPIDMARAASGSDGWLACCGMTDGKRNRDGDAGSSGVEAAVTSNGKDDPILYVPVPMYGYGGSRQAPGQTSARVDSYCCRRLLEARHLHIRT